MSKRRTHGPAHRQPADRASVGRNGLYVPPDGIAEAFKLVDDRRADNQLTPFSGKGRKVTERATEKTAEYAQLHQLLGGLAKLEDRSSEGAVSPAFQSLSKQAGWVEDVVAWLEKAFGGQASGWDILRSILGGAGQAQADPTGDDPVAARWQNESAGTGTEQEAYVNPTAQQVPEDFMNALEGLQMYAQRDPRTGEVKSYYGGHGNMLADSGLSSLTGGLVPEGSTTDFLGNNFIQDGLRSIQVPGDSLRNVPANLLNPTTLETLIPMVATWNTAGGPITQTAENVLMPAIYQARRSRDLGKIQAIRDTIARNPEYAASPEGRAMLWEAGQALHGGMQQGGVQGDYKGVVDYNGVVDDNTLRQMQYARAIAPDAALTSVQESGHVMNAAPAVFNLLEKSKLGPAAGLVSAAEAGVTVADWLNRARQAQQYNPGESYRNAFADVYYGQGMDSANKIMGGRNTSTLNQIENSLGALWSNPADWVAATSGQNEMARLAAQKSRQGRANAKGMKRRMLDMLNKQRETKGYAFTDPNQVPYDYKRQHPNWLQHVKMTTPQKMQWDADVMKARKTNPQQAKMMETGHGAGKPLENMSRIDKYLGKLWGVKGL